MKYCVIMTSTMIVFPQKVTPVCDSKTCPEMTGIELEFLSTKNTLWKSRRVPGNLGFKLEPSVTCEASNLKANE